MSVLRAFKYNHHQLITVQAPHENYHPPSIAHDHYMLNASLVSNDASNQQNLGPIDGKSTCSNNFNI